MSREHLHTVAMTRCAIYCRISRDRHGAGLGVSRQSNDCRALADRLGLTVVVEHTDNDLSAYSGKRRPGYEALLDDIRNGRVDAVLAWHTDRLHRSPYELEGYIAACDVHGVPTYTVTAGQLDLATPSGKLVARQLGAVARYEVEHMIERQRRAKLDAATRGVWKGGRRPFGFEADGVTVRQSEAALVLRGSQDILRGVSVRAMAAMWQDSGIPTTTGLEWRDVSVRRVLMRPRNAGLMEHRGEVLGKANWPAIVPEHIWRGVVAILGDPSRRTQMSSARRWLGSGLYICDLCGNGMRAAFIGGKRVYAYHAYVCLPTKHLGRLAEGVDGFVTETVLQRLRRPEAVELFAPEPQNDAAELAVEIAALREQLDELARLFAARKINASQLSTASTALQDQLGTAESRMANVSRGSEFHGLVGVDDVAQAWDGLSLDRRRQVVNALMTVTILPAPRGRRPGWRPGEKYFDPDTVRIDWKR